MGRFLTFICLLTLIAACNKQTVVETPAADADTPVVPESGLNADLAEIDIQLNNAEQLQQKGDSLALLSVDIENHYRFALEALDSLANVYRDNAALTAMTQRVNNSYDAYASRYRGEVDDSLSAAAVMADLDTLLSGDIEGSMDSTVVEDAPRLTIPMSDHPKVLRAIRYFTKTRKGRRVMNTWLKRAGKYETLVKGHLRDVGAPEELFYLAMIESGLRPTVRSYARAVGMWQFIYATGKYYGLTRSWWYDDRKDPVKATRAAGQHLLDLRERFGDWYLGLAGYNFNPRKIERKMAAYNVSSYWDVPRLPRQTRNYVPTFLAAVTIASDPAKFDFDIEPYDPIAFDTVTVTECIDLNVVAEVVGSTFREMKNLNPALLRWCTPPDRESWLLNIPSGTREIFMKKYPEIPREEKFSWIHHRIRSGETLSTIARRYGVAMAEIKRFNKIRGSFIRAGQDIIIPIPQNKKHYRKYVASKSKSSRSSVSRQPRKPVKKITSLAGHTRYVYIVKKGDTFWEISQTTGMKISDIKSWNGYRYSKIIRPGQQLNIFVKNGSTPPPGVQKPGALLASVQRQNSGPRATDNQESAGKSSAAPAKTRTVVHKVRSGDTLWDIAQSYNVSVGDIKRWNKKRGTRLKPGEELTIEQTIQ